MNFKSDYFTVIAPIKTTRDFRASGLQVQVYCYSESTFLKNSCGESAARQFSLWRAQAGAASLDFSHRTTTLWETQLFSQCLILFIFETKNSTNCIELENCMDYYMQRHQSSTHTGQTRKSIWATTKGVEGADNTWELLLPALFYFIYFLMIYLKYTPEIQQ